jgi:hypothetical protein
MEPWLGGVDKYKGEKLVVLGGSSSVGSYGLCLIIVYLNRKLTNFFKNSYSTSHNLRPRGYHHVLPGAF